MRARRSTVYPPPAGALFDCRKWCTFRLPLTLLEGRASSAAPARAAWRSRSARGRRHPRPDGPLRATTQVHQARRSERQRRARAPRSCRSVLLRKRQGQVCAGADAGGAERKGLGTWPLACMSEDGARPGPCDRDGPERASRAPHASRAVRPELRRRLRSACAAGPRLRRHQGARDRSRPGRRGRPAPARRRWGWPRLRVVAAARDEPAPPAVVTHPSQTRSPLVRLGLAHLSDARHAPRRRSRRPDRVSTPFGRARLCLFDLAWEMRMSGRPSTGLLQRTAGNVRPEIEIALRLAVIDARMRESTRGCGRCSMASAPSRISRPKPGGALSCGWS